VERPLISHWLGVAAHVPSPQQYGVAELQQPSSIPGQHCSELRQQPPLSQVVYSLGQLCPAAGATQAPIATDRAIQIPCFIMLTLAQ
jgi:hypothetical protein